MIKVSGIFDVINQKIRNNKNLAANIFGAFAIKGLGMVVSLLTMPYYIDYFGNNTVLGLWFTILTVLNWILSCDIGIGNGLRNYLTEALSQNNKVKARNLISSSYFILGLFSALLILVAYVSLPYINWNSIFNVDASLINNDLLIGCVRIIISGILLSFFLRIINSILYALQLSSVNNFLSLITNVLILIYLIVTSGWDAGFEEKLVTISWAYAFIINVPLIGATIFVFLFTSLRDSSPSLRFISKSAIKSVVALGGLFFIIQIFAMIINVSNEWFISKFFQPAYCVDYQIYSRAFTLFSGIFTLALTPLWSAITKAYAERKYDWVIKLYKYLKYLALLIFFVELCILPILQYLFNIWLKENTIEVDYYTAVLFLIYGVISIWMAIQGTLTSGLGKLKVSFYTYFIAVCVKIAGVVIVSQYTDRWDVVVLITSIALLPYCILQPIYVKRKLNELKTNI